MFENKAKMSHFFVLPVLADKIVGFWRKNITFIALNTELVMMRKMRSFWVTFNQCVVLSCYAYRVDTYTVSHSLIAPKWASSILVRCLCFLSANISSQFDKSIFFFVCQSLPFLSILSELCLIFQLRPKCPILPICSTLFQCCLALSIDKVSILF